MRLRFKRERGQPRNPLCRLSVPLTGAAYCHLNFDTFRYRDGLVNGRNEYQGKALECVREAERLRDAGERKKLLQIAGLYMSLARRLADRHDHGSRREHHPDDA
jgi:hypothetical protein